MAAVAMDPATEAEKAAKAATREADKARKKAEKAAKEAAKAAAAEARAAAGPVQIKLVPKPPVELESCPGTRDFYPEDMRVRATSVGSSRAQYTVAQRTTSMMRIET